MLKSAGNAAAFWPLFEQKISCFNDLLQISDVFEKYSEYVLRKFIYNGYDRIEFRVFLIELKEYDKDGVFTGTSGDQSFADAFDRAYDRVKQDFPNLTVGFIFLGLKSLSLQQNEAILRKVAELRWKLTVGIDFIQSEDYYGSL